MSTRRPSPQTARTEQRVRDAILQLRTAHSRMLELEEETPGVLEACFSTMADASDVIARSRTLRNVSDAWVDRNRNKAAAK